MLQRRAGDVRQRPVERVPGDVDRLHRVVREQTARKDAGEVVSREEQFRAVSRRRRRRRRQRPVQRVLAQIDHLRVRR
eukprot:8993-Pelagococcus_subviridis.AAC.1